MWFLLDNKWYEVKDPKCAHCSNKGFFGILDGETFLNVCLKHFLEYKEKHDQMLENIGGKEVVV